MTLTKQKIDVVKISLIILLPIFVILTTSTQIIFYSGVPYEMDKIEVHLSNALKTNDPESKLSYLETTYEQLDKYHGNSGFLFPTEVSDIDVTKELLKSAIIKTKHELGVTDKAQWMVLPHNEFDQFLEKNINSIINRIDRYVHAYGGNPTINTWLLPIILMGNLIWLVPIILELTVNRNRKAGYEMDPHQNNGFWYYY